MSAEESENDPVGGDSAGGRETAAPQASELSLRDQLEAARAERDANYDLCLRAQAELQNSRKRAQKEIEELRQYESLSLARDLLPALDNLGRAVAVAETTKNVDELVKGVKLVAKQIEDAFARHQVLPIESVGKPFDPNIHQAIQQVPTNDHPPMTVIQEAERGFRLKDRVVRPSIVIVAQSPEAHESSTRSKQAEQADSAKAAEQSNADI